MISGNIMMFNVINTFQSKFVVKCLKDKGNSMFCLHQCVQITKYLTIGLCTVEYYIYIKLFPPFLLVCFVFFSLSYISFVSCRYLCNICLSVFCLLPFFSHPF